MNNPNPNNSHHKLGSAILTWDTFILQEVKQQPKFPYNSIDKFLHTSKNIITLKQLLQIWPITAEKYKSNYENYKEVLVLLYLIVVKKGCTLKSVLNAAVTILQNLLQYRIILISSTNQGQPKINEVFNYLSEWMEEIVPKLLNLQQNPFISLFHNLNNQRNTHQFDQILVLFEFMLIKIIRCNLSDESAADFYEFLNEIYEESKMKRLQKALEDQKNSTIKRRQILLQIQSIVPIRQNEQKWQLSDLLLYQDRSNSPSKLFIKKVNRKKLIEAWVIESYQNNPKPVNVKFQHLLSMRVLELYRFLCMLQIYGSSPKIQLLNDYMDNQQFFDFFGQFLLGQDLCQSKYKYGNKQMKLILEKLSHQLKQFCHQEKKIIVGEVGFQIKKQNN